LEAQELIRARMTAEDAIVDRIRPLPFGAALETPSCPQWHAGNALRVTSAPSGPGDVLSAAADVIERLGWTHRRVVIMVPALVDPLAAAAVGWTVMRLLVMARRRPPDRTLLDWRVGLVSPEEHAAMRGAFIVEQPWASPAAVAQMLTGEGRLDAIGRARRVGVRTAAGELVGVASALGFGAAWEIDKVSVLEAHRGHGYGRAVTAAAIASAVESGAEDVFLLAEADDPRPQRLYGQLGFDVVTTIAELLGPPAPPGEPATPSTEDRTSA
jgi:ribosomal protein S18 acetylase RimI-like enzyme